MADLQARRRDAFAFVFIVLFASLLVAVLANILFARYFSKSPVVVTLLTASGLLVCVVAVFVLVLSATEQKASCISYPVLYSCDADSFIDIPYSKGSIHARLAYQHMTTAERAVLKHDLEGQELPWGGAFHQFVDDCIQELILAVVLGSAHVDEVPPGRRAIRIGQLPQGAQTNPVLRRLADLSPDTRVLLPTWISIDTFAEEPAHFSGLNVETLGARGRFVRLNSAYGRVDVKWSSSFGSAPLSRYPNLLALLEHEQQESIILFNVAIALFYRTSFLRMFSKGMNKHIDWLMALDARFGEFDWTRDRVGLLLAAMKRLDDHVKRRD